MVSREEDLEIDIETGRSNVTQESTSGNVVHIGESEKSDDVLIYPLIGNENPSTLSSDNIKSKKSRNAAKPPRHPKTPSFMSMNDHKMIKDIEAITKRKRARIERMKESLKRIKAAKSSSSWVGIFSMVVTVMFFVVLIFQGFFTGRSNLRPGRSVAPTISPNSQFVSVQFNNEFAPVEQIDPSPTTSFRRGIITD